jgi:hypothetical protein
MKKILLLVLVGAPLFWACDSEEVILSQECLHSAVVEDLSGLDGCGYLFKLSNGEYLQPVAPLGWCATPPLPEGYYEDPLRNFQFEEGKRVRIGFEYTNDYSSACMKGKMVFIKCIEEIPVEEPAE